MKTPIHTSKKLEKLVKTLITTNSDNSSGLLGKLNATVFLVNRKKCWLISNAKTQYLVILIDIKSADLKNINTIYLNAFAKQLAYDGILTDYKILSEIIGTLEFLPTDNDKKTNGFLNHSLRTLEAWKNEFGSLDKMPIADLTNRLNTSAILIGKGRKMSDYTEAKTEMKQLLKSIGK